MSELYNLAHYIDTHHNNVWSSFGTLQIEGIIIDGDLEITDAPQNFSHPPSHYSLEFQPFGTMVDRFDNSRPDRVDLMEIFLACVYHWFVPDWKGKTYYFTWRSKNTNHNPDKWTIEFREEEDVDAPVIFTIDRQQLRKHND